MINLHVLLTNGEPSPPGGNTGPKWEAVIFWSIGNPLIGQKLSPHYPGPSNTYGSSIIFQQNKLYLFISIISLKAINFEGQIT